MVWLLKETNLDIKVYRLTPTTTDKKMYQNQGATATTQPIVLANMPPMPLYLPYPQPYSW